MSTIASLMIRLGVDTRNVKRDAESAGPVAEKAGQKAGSRWASGFGGAARAVRGLVATAAAALSIGAVAHGVMELTTASSDLHEITSKTGVLFGSATNEVLKFAAGAEKALGQSQKAALDGASTFAVYGKGAGLAGQKLVKFSTGLVTTASDMASFANTSPEEAIEAIGAAMRGESDPIEKYGVLLNEATLKNRAFEMGLISTTTKALSPQQRVLAVQAELYEQLGKKGSNTLGDFARTSGSLANQQRILSAGWQNMKAKVGDALLPVMTAFVTTLNTDAIPALQQLWAVHGPKVTAALTELATNAGPALSGLVDKVTAVDWVAVWDRAHQVLIKLGPAVSDLGSQSSLLAPSMEVAGVIVRFLADNLDTLGQLLPWIAGGYVAIKTAQAAANVSAALAPILAISDYVAKRRLTAANLELAAATRAATLAQRTGAVSQAASTAATTAGDAANKRGIVSTIAMRVATLAGAAASSIAAAATWALNAALSPIGLIVIGIILLIAGLVLIVIWLWRNNEGFRKFIIGAWNAIWGFLKGVGAWFAGPFVDFWVNAFRLIMNSIGKARMWIWDKFMFLIGLPQMARDKISKTAKGMWDAIPGALKGAINMALRAWNGLDLGVNIGIPDWVPKPFGGKRFVIPDLIPDIPLLASGGYVPATPGGTVAVVGEGRSDEIVDPEPHQRQMIREAVAAGGGGQINVNLIAKDRAMQALMALIQVMVERVDDETAAAVAGGVR